MKSIIIKILLLSFIGCSVMAQSIKLDEAFDSLDVESRGWRLINNDGSMDDYPAFTGAFTFTNTGLLAPQKGNYFIHFDALNANEQGVIDHWVITPNIKSVGQFDRFTFWCGAVDVKYKDSLRVLVSTSGNETGNFVEIDRFKVDGPSGTWHEKAYDLSAFAGKDIFIAVNYLMRDAGVLGANSDNIWIDHFTVKSAFGPDIVVTNSELFQNFPNPFNPSTEIVFSIQEDANVQIIIYDITGKEIQKLVNESYQSGRYNVKWNATGLSSGTYFYSISAKSLSAGKVIIADTKQMVFIK